MYWFPLICQTLILFSLPAFLSWIALLTKSFWTICASSSWKNEQLGTAHPNTNLNLKSKAQGAKLENIFIKTKDRTDSLVKIWLGLKYLTFWAWGVLVILGHKVRLPDLDQINLTTLSTLMLLVWIPKEGFDYKMEESVIFTH